MGLAAKELEKSIRAVARRDTHVRAALKAIGMPSPRAGEPGFATLLAIMLGQQLSIKAAATIRRRLIELLGEVTPEAVLCQSEEALRAVGLSRQKVAYARALATAVAQGALDFNALARLPDEEAGAAIRAVKGFGQWSADIYLLFCEGRPDIWPAGDLALQVALQRLKGLAARPTAKESLSHVAPWRPHRGAMAVFLWHYYANSAAPI
ncbi:MAG: DNA-3-methyladenine glycosylase family protein [Pseudomonadota bacterium]